MQVYSNWINLHKKHDNLVVGLGNFDGIHLGHQKLIGDLVSRARAAGATPAVFTFVPHPLTVLNPEGAPPMLLPQDLKQEMFAGLGVEVLVVIPFTREFARMYPEDFITTVLHRHLAARAVYVGYNYTFGHMGRGTPELLKQYGDELGFAVEVIKPVTVDGKPVSSTLIRSLLADGEIAQARKYLGYCPIVEGEVVYGERRGNTLGFPTANLEVESNLLVPANGVYSVKVRVGREIYWGVTNIGIKPTFHGNAYARTIEVHLLDFCGNLYGRKMRVYFIRRLREEKRFHSVGELVKQIQRDINEARVDAAGQV
ncbi:bifunctional riboflavin kinase/FAD synthetase [Desulfoscipio geothermicus]|uniref:Riboflavin biosynthesis protein n=1 Tax=Desulfoscipio geothermicus DSM 3669 TaxID=1121426 RepID=A0A1I6D8N6_9FIRM|nr:bifunctional riboflavin kinase/FAD synthetase [Desulfoscipio geothermicus]SFR01731.1 riboflavin kinase / FMN adenylyltransferase [Desulfoscipio geothermicus DSM 3669]